MKQASLELVKIDRKWEILNGDEHQQYMKRKNLNPADYRPDIVHQCVLSLLDSPLNKAGYLDLYIHTTNNVLIKVNPQTRIPRTLKRFCGLTVQLLQDLKIFGHGLNKPLLQIIQNPITNHLPDMCWKTVCSYNCENLMSPHKHAQEVLKKDMNILYVIGAMAHGKIVEEWADEELKISSFPLSASAKSFER
ncbi:Ribosomal RNA small subunit methyltransferase NEP1 [Galdieria sulphuraria]|nr:Ribosomal RNA small subunit methyltransferase NEP1 [Galdieria sulphuraria]